MGNGQSSSSGSGGNQSNLSRNFCLNMSMVDQTGSITPLRSCCVNSAGIMSCNDTSRNMSSVSSSNIPSTTFYSQHHFREFGARNLQQNITLPSLPSFQLPPTPQLPRSNFSSQYTANLESSRKEFEESLAAMRQKFDAQPETFNQEVDLKRTAPLKVSSFFNHQDFTSLTGQTLASPMNSATEARKILSQERTKLQEREYRERKKQEFLSKKRSTQEQRINPIEINAISTEIDMTCGLVLRFLNDLTIKPEDAVYKSLYKLHEVHSKSKEKAEVAAVALVALTTNIAAQYMTSDWTDSLLGTSQGALQDTLISGFENIMANAASSLVANGGDIHKAIKTLIDEGTVRNLAVAILNTSFVNKTKAGTLPTDPSAIFYNPLNDEVKNIFIDTILAAFGHNLDLFNKPDDISHATSNQHTLLQAMLGISDMDNATQKKEQLIKVFDPIITAKLAKYRKKSEEKQQLKQQLVKQISDCLSLMATEQKYVVKQELLNEIIAEKLAEFKNIEELNNWGESFYFRHASVASASEAMSFATNVGGFAFGGSSAFPLIAAIARVAPVGGIVVGGTVIGTIVLAAIAKYAYDKYQENQRAKARFEQQSASAESISDSHANDQVPPLLFSKKHKEDKKRSRPSEADKEREKNKAKGIPESALGPSGKPKIIKPKHTSKKTAEDSAVSDGRRGEAPDHHPNPVEGDPHFHPSGSNHRVHHSYPKKGPKYHPPKKRD